MPRLPRNLHHVTPSHSADNAIRRKHATPHESAAPARQNDIGGLQSTAPATKNATHRVKTQHSKSIAPATQNDFWHVVKYVGMPRSATPATQNDRTTSSDTSKKSRFCDFSHRHGNFEATTAADGRLRTVADGCERLRMVANGCGRLRTPEAGSREHVNPQTPKCKTRTLRYAFGNIFENHKRTN